MTLKLHMRQKNKRIWAAAIATMIALNGQPALAQPAANDTLKVISCDPANYPQVTCLVTVLDRNGLPIPGLKGTDFAVTDIDAKTPVEGMSVTEIVAKEGKTATMLVLDLSGSQNGALLQTLKDSAVKSLTDMPLNDTVALIAVTGPVDIGNTSDNPPIDTKKESDFTVDKNAIINTFRNLPPGRATPLSEAIYKALLLTRKQAGARAVVVMSDGQDTQSKTFTVDYVIDRAKAEAIPVFTMGFGRNLDKDNLRKIAIETGGQYFDPPASTEASAANFRLIQDRLKTQYQLSFKAFTPSDNNEHPLALTLNLLGRELKVNTAFRTSFPVKPDIQAQFTHEGQPIEPGNLQSGEIKVVPAIQIRDNKIAQIEYELDGKTTVQKQAPFEFDFNTRDLGAGSAHKLIVRVFGDLARPETINEKAFDLTVIDAVAPTSAAPAPEPTPAPTSPLQALIERVRGNPLLLAVIGVGALALIVLVSMIVVTARRNRQSNDGFGLDTQTQTQIVSAVDDAAGLGSTGIAGVGNTMIDHTQIFPDDPFDMAAPKDKTMILKMGKAGLKFLNGDSKDQVVQIGIEDAPQLIGRDVSGPMAILLKSGYVSKQHARITLEGDDMVLMDLGSSSGTKINGQKLAPNTSQKIRVNDKLSFADVNAIVIDAEEL